jgi:hypothetical protein
MIQIWNYRRPGDALQLSRVCHILCILDLVCGQSLSCCVTQCMRHVLVFLLDWPMIQMWHYGRQGDDLKLSRVCHVPCTLDLVSRHPLCPPCDPMYEASLMFLMFLFNYCALACCEQPPLMAYVFLCRVSRST